jgi:DNA-binding NarL/FixJ family response regulator
MNDRQTRIFLFEPHPLMVLGINSLIGGNEGLVLCGSSSNHHTLVDDLGSARPDILILDLSLFTVESLQLIQRIRGRFPGLKIVLLSNHTGTDYVAKAQKAGVDAYVLKTDDPACILDAVRSTLEGRPYVSGRVAKPGERPARPIDSPINLLSTRQFQVLQHVGKGYANRQIADDLQMPLDTVEEEIGAIQEKLGLPSFLELLQFAFHWVHHEGGFS